MIGGCYAALRENMFIVVLCCISDRKAVVLHFGQEEHKQRVQQRATPQCNDSVAGCNAQSHAAMLAGMECGNAMKAMLAAMFEVRRLQL